VSNTKQNESGTCDQNFFLRVGKKDLLKSRSAVAVCVVHLFSNNEQASRMKSVLCKLVNLFCVTVTNSQCKLISAPTVLLKLKSVY